MHSISIKDEEGIRIVRQGCKLMSNDSIEVSGRLLEFCWQMSLNESAL